MTKQFWDKEYKNPEHLTLSEEPSSDMLSFIKWVQRNAEWPAFNQGGMVLDIGCGNGRNIGNLCQEFKMKGIGLDLSRSAIDAAKNKFKGIKFIEGNIKNVQDMDILKELEPESLDIVLDMMVIHFLNKKERSKYINFLASKMKPFSWMFLKTFILEGDSNAHRMIKDYPTVDKEENSYIHPKFKVLEHVFTDEELIQLFDPYFKIHKLIKSHKHIKDGRPFKRRTVSLYLERKRD